jgi:ectoine hydroxylase-related dioxygenase (phytanoyl-CoA dioxygenase family)
MTTLNYSVNFKKENNAYLSYYFDPMEGGMILFPSHLAHRVNENKSDEDRISIAFNIKFD